MQPNCPPRAALVQYDFLYLVVIHASQTVLAGIVIGIHGVINFCVCVHLHSSLKLIEATNRRVIAS